jgi:hypothetical protein
MRTFTRDMTTDSGNVSVNRETKEQFANETLDFWGCRTSRELTAEDASEIARNLSGFFKVLIEWDSTTREVRDGAKDDTRTKKATSVERRSQ